MPRLTNKTDALIVANRQDLTGNLQQAREYGVRMVDEPDVLVSIGVTNEAIDQVVGRWARS